MWEKQEAIKERELKRFRRPFLNRPQNPISAPYAKEGYGETAYAVKTCPSLVYA